MTAADALHTPAQQATAITGPGGHYLFTVKTNAKRLHTQISQAGWARRKPQYRHREKAHGRTSSWQATVMAAPGFIECPQAGQIILIQRGRDEHRHSQVEATGEIVYVITSLPAAAANPTVLAQLLRGHWGIENRLHWVRDTGYDEDASQIRTGKAAHFMASMRNLSISAHRLAGEANITAALPTTDATPTSQPNSPDFEIALVWLTSLERGVIVFRTELTICRLDERRYRPYVASTRECSTWNDPCPHL